MLKVKGFDHVRFDVDISIDIDPQELHWPDERQARSAPMHGNQEYRDLRGITWEQATRAYAAEEAFLRRLDAVRTERDLRALHPAAKACALQTFGLDLGTASTVAAVSASGLIPFASCNGGAFGGSHHEPHPLVGFFAKPAVVTLLRTSAEMAGIGLGVHRRGGLVAYSDDIRRMRAFARSLIDNAELLTRAGGGQLGGSDDLDATLLGSDR